MKEDIKARRKRERKGVVRGEGWVECAELARGGARDRGKTEARLELYNLAGLKPDTDRGGIHKKL